MTIKIENSYAQYLIGPRGENLGFIDKRTGKNCCTSGSLIARIRKAGLEYPVSAASFTNGRTTLQFGDSGVSAEITITAKEHYFIVAVLSISDQAVDEFTFIDIPLTLKDSVKESFTGCALALNLQTNVIELPGANQRLRAICYPRFGFVGAKAAIIGCSQGKLRQVIQEAVSDAPDLPHSPKGGPWALDDPANRGSYIIGTVTEETVDNWINFLKAVGFNQFDLHGGEAFRFGDCRLNPEMYPRGRASLKTVIDKFHAEGIMVGLHTYSFFIDKECPWVTPVPDPRLGKDAVFTLSESISADATKIPVLESTKDMSTVTGFFVRNSVTLQIEDELIVYRGIWKGHPDAFTECQRGALGTEASPHRKGAKVYHLKQCWNLFAPDGDSSLLAEVAAASADLFNECGFDMMYLDALDGEDILGGHENSWHYGSKFVFELWKRLKKPALMEMSTFHHHLWFVRSRHGAWDHPSRSHKHFIDLHVAANEDCRRIFLPAHLGWWSILKWIGIQGEPVFTDDIEYLCGKCLGTDSGFSLSGIKPNTLEMMDNFGKDPVIRRMAGIIKQYETLRHEGYFPESVKAKLRAPGAEFKLIEVADQKWQFRPVQYTKHKVEALNEQSNIWRVKNKFDRQPLKLRIEVLMSVTPYDAGDNITLTDFSDPAEFSDRETAEGIVADLRPSTHKIKAGGVSGCYSAWRTGGGPAETERTWAFSLAEHGVITSRDKAPSWTKMSKKFSPPLNLGEDINVGGEHQGLGLWVYGDGQGELLNIQLRSPENMSRAVGDHYIIIDFTGWQYFELVEHEGERIYNYSWPYAKSVYWTHGYIFHPKVETLSLWYNNLPMKGKATCYLSPIKALKLVKAKLKNPTIAVGGEAIVFPTEIETGCYLEFNSIDDCKLYSPQGDLVSEVNPQGTVPLLQKGENEVRFTCVSPEGVNARIRVTVMTEGDII